MSATASTDGRRTGGSLSGARAVAATAVFIALAVALGYLLAPVPNVELVTLAVFVSGVALGRARGAVVGAATMAIYSGFSPNGSGVAIPPMYVAQIAAMSISGFAGGLTAGYWRSPVRRPRWRTAAAACAVGLFLTAFYQCSVIVGLAIAMPEFNEGLLAALVANAFFSSLHLLSNAVVFTVVAPALFARLGKATAFLVVALAAIAAAATPVKAQVAEAVQPDTTRPARVAEAATADTSDPEWNAEMIPPDTLRPEHAIPEPPGDIRVAGAGGEAELLAREPGVRLVGTGWHGQAVSIARGALPSTLTRGELHGRSVGSWGADGSPLVAVASQNGVARHVACGPDLSLWPVHTPSDAQDLSGGGQPTVEYSPWLPPPARPYGRFTMTSGDPGRRSTATLFGRQFGGGAVGLSAFMEQDGGRAPVPGGTYDRDVAGGSAALRLSGGRSLEVDAQRTRLERGVPAAVSREDGPLDETRVVSNVDLSVTGGGTRVGIFHDEGWAELRERGGVRRSVELSGDGACAHVASGTGPLDSVDVVVASRLASGTALSERDRVLEVDGAVSGEVAVARGLNLALSGGWRQSGHLGYPVASAVLSGSREAGPGNPRTFLSLCAMGRHATALERRSALAGSASLRPERAVLLSGGWEDDWRSVTVGSRAEVARIFDPIALPDASSDSERLRNAADETSGSLSLWASTADQSSLGTSVSVELTVVDPDGSIIEREPVPLAAASATLWLSHTLFAHEYVEARWDITLLHDEGRARGPWDGLVTDSATTLSAHFTASAGSARVYVLMDDILDCAPSRVPGFPGPGRSLSAGFSWSFWD